jgi:hypothetical protein
MKLPPLSGLVFSRRESGGGGGGGGQTTHTTNQQTVFLNKGQTKS